VNNDRKKTNEEDTVKEEEYKEEASCSRRTAEAPKTKTGST